MHFVDGHIAYGYIYSKGRKVRPEIVRKPKSNVFTLVDTFDAIAHVVLPNYYLTRKLVKFYKDLEYPSCSYTLMRPGDNPERLRKRDKKLFILSDLLKTSLWANRHLVWFQDNTPESLYRVRSRTIRQDLDTVIARILKGMACLD